MLNGILYVVLRGLAVLAPRVSIGALYVIADLAGTLAFWVLPSLRRTIIQNFSQVLPEAAPSVWRRHARRAFCNDARNWIDTLRIPAMSNQELASLVEVDHWELLEKAADDGHGAVIVTMHLGNFDLVGQVLAARGWRLTVPVQRMEPSRLFDFLVAARSSRGITIVPLEHAPRAMVGALARHEFVGLAIDRHIIGKTLEVKFFGRPTHMPRGFASLVRHADVPVFLGVGVRLPGGRFQGHVKGPFTMERGVGLDAERHNTQLLLAEMESLVRRYPDQWLAFWPVWPSDVEVNTPDKVEQRSEAAP